MSDIKIDKNIPIPKKNTSRSGKWVDTVMQMQIGDSVIVDDYIKCSSMRTAFNRCYGKSTYTIRKQDDGTYRIWRIA